VQVVGIEMNESAVLDAHRNSVINGIKNCRFVCAKVRLILPSMKFVTLSLFNYLHIILFNPFNFLIFLFHKIISFEFICWN
jgi:tRNA/tmRNA/rRNA uracil-C5-methylase (TrmA/RlmC/RlmD family)